MHRDDELEGGRIRRLAKAIQNEYELLTGDRLNLFVDNENIEWGNEWRGVIDSALLQTAFFVPLITPLYLRSEQCRREFVEFVGRASSANARELVLPIIYAETPAVTDPDTQDEVARIVQQIQWEDWRKLRLAEESSPEYRSAVNKVANRLVAIAAEVAERPVEPLIDEAGDDSPGSLDQMAIAEHNIFRWAEIMADLGKDLPDLANIARDHLAKLKESDRRGGGMRGRLVVMNEFANALSGISERVLENGLAFSRSAIEADPGIQAIIRMIHGEAESDEEREQVEQFYRQIEEVSETGTAAVVSLRDLIQNIDNVQSLARVVKTPMRQLRKGLTGVIDGVTVLNGWSRLIDEVRGAAS
ncbi:hypothetical protein Asi02nite_48130 [Asanoa siamensis]|uniref:TIR domain-containing protein n=1 Tax=Asanoa siamensis TaxID=926357 RepID=A0ABQ4CVK2_9ACTN|nr:hypothetical protein Asi02nite_48130 [Asanoa siamensis]